MLRATNKEKKHMSNTTETIVPEFLNPEHVFHTGFMVSRVTEQDTDTWLKMGQLRTKIYVDERSFLPPEVVNDDGAEYDGDDANSEHFVAMNDKTEVIGTIRVIHRGENGKLPSEKLFGIDLPVGAREISRIMVDSMVPRRLKSLVSMSLIRAALQATTDRDDNVYAVIEPSLGRYLDEMIGIKLTSIAEPRFIEEYNTVNSVVSMHPRSVASQVHDRDKFPRSIPYLPENLGLFFEQNTARTGLGRVALGDAGHSKEER
jgi:N-acyl-L-homoserine lactone synthetase